MKGLIVKDFRLLFQRKRFFLLMAACAVMMAVSMDNSSFVVGWICTIMGIFSLSTMSYDEYDNSMPFLMSLPVSAKDYAIEKYVFGLICGMAGWLFAVAVELIMVFIGRTAESALDVLISSLVFLPLLLVFLSICIPCQLKWGAEKGRTYMLVLYGFLLGSAAIAVKFLPNSKDIDQLLAGTDVWMIAIIVFVAVIAIYYCSMLISVRVFSKKEF